MPEIGPDTSHLVGGYVPRSHSTLHMLISQQTSRQAACRVSAYREFAGRLPCAVAITAQAAALLWPSANDEELLLREKAGLDLFVDVTKSERG